MTSKTADKLPNMHSTDFNGIPVVIQWPKGSTRVGKRRDGTPFKTEMRADYGYVPDTVASGDEERLDVYIGPDPDAEHAYVVEQVRKPSGELDEYKVMLGFGSFEEAVESYEYHIGDNPDVELGDVSEVRFDHLFDAVAEERARDGEQEREEIGAELEKDEAKVAAGGRRQGPPGDTFRWQGRAYWSGAVNVLDGGIEEAHTYWEAEAAGFHHSLYFGDHAVGQMDDGEWAFFCVRADGAVYVSSTQREELSAAQELRLAARIKEQVKVTPPRPAGGRRKEMKLAPERGGFGWWRCRCGNAFQDQTGHTEPDDPGFTECDKWGHPDRDAGEALRCNGCGTLYEFGPWDGRTVLLELDTTEPEQLSLTSSDHDDGLPVIDTFMKHYEHEVDFYDEAARLARDTLDQALQDAGIRAIVTSRAKRPGRLRAKLEKRDRKRHYRTFRDVLADIVDLETAQRDSLTALYQGGAGALADVLVVEQQLAIDRQAVAQARQRQAAAVTLLKTLLGSGSPSTSRPTAGPWARSSSGRSPPSARRSTSRRTGGRGTRSATWPRTTSSTCAPRGCTRRSSATPTRTSRCRSCPS